MSPCTGTEFLLNWLFLCYRNQNRRRSERLGDRCVCVVAQKTQRKWSFLCKHTLKGPWPAAQSAQVSVSVTGSQPHAEPLTLLDFHLKCLDLFPFWNSQIRRIKQNDITENTEALVDWKLILRGSHDHDQENRKNLSPLHQIMIEFYVFFLKLRLYSVALLDKLIQKRFASKPRDRKSLFVACSKAAQRFVCVTDRFESAVWV